MSARETDPLSPGDRETAALDGGFSDPLPDEPFPECPACGGPGVELGTLGRRQHFRCRNCGIDFSRERGAS